MTNSPDMSVERQAAVRDVPHQIIVTPGYGVGTVWVTNFGPRRTGSLTELNAATGRPVRVLAGASQGVQNPTAVAVDGANVWVANLGRLTRTGFSGFGSVTELNANTGAVERQILGKPGGIAYPQSITASGPNVWVLSGGYRGSLGAVSDLNANDGSLIWTKSGASYGFERPDSIAASGSHLWVLNDPYRGALSVTEMNASDGTFLRRLDGGQYDFGRFTYHFNPRALGASPNRVWVANFSGGGGSGSVTEINGQTGSLVRVLSGNPYHFDGPVAIAVDGSRVWIANYGPSNSAGWLTVLDSFR